MNTNLSIKLLCATAMLGTATTICAQEDKSKDNDALNREMTLEREFDPTVQDANKVNTLPAVKEPEVTPRPIDYASFTSPADPEKQIATLPAGNIQTAIDYNRHRGYLDFAAGMHRNINGDFGYHILSTEKDKLNFYFSHRSTKWDTDVLAVNEYVEAKLNDNLGGINYEHEFEKAILKIGAKYGYSAFNYYGLPVGRCITNNWCTTGIDEYASDRKTNQVNQTIAATVGIESPESQASDKVGYQVDLSYINFGHKYGIGKFADGPTENTFELGFNLFKNFWSIHNIGISGLFEYFNYSIPAEKPMEGSVPEGNFYQYHFKNHAEGAINPYYRVGGENWNLKIGGKFMFATGEESKIMGSPDVALDVTVADRTVFYLTAGGKLYSNSMYDVSNICRYIDPTRELEPSKNWLDGIIGIKSGVARGFWFDIFAGYKITDNDLLFLPPSSYYDGHFTNLINGYQAINTKLFYVGANLKYKYQQWFEIGVKGIYNNWSGDYGDNIIGPNREPEHVWGKPEFVFDADVTIRPIDKLTIALSYHLETGRYTLPDAPDATNIFKMKDINELNLRASYDFNRTFGLYAQVNNLLNQGYDIFYGYPAQGITVMGGISLRF